MGKGSRTTQKQDTQTTNIQETTTTTTQIDARKGVSDQGVLLEEGANLNLDNSVRIEDASAEVVALGVQPAREAIGGATIVGTKALDTSVNLVDRTAELTEKSLDTSAQAFTQSVGLAETSLVAQNQLANRAIESTEGLAKTSLTENIGLIRDLGTQQGNLGRKFLEDTKSLVKDTNREAGERLGQTAIIAGGLLAVAVIFFAFRGRRKG